MFELSCRDFFLFLSTTYRHRSGSRCTEISKHFPDPPRSQWRTGESPSSCSICPWSPSVWSPAPGLRCWGCSRRVSGSRGGSDRPWLLSPVGAPDCKSQPAEDVSPEVMTGRSGRSWSRRHLSEEAGCSQQLRLCNILSVCAKYEGFPFIKAAENVLVLLSRCKYKKKG